MLLHVQELARLLQERGEPDSECWCLNNAIFYAVIIRLTVEERVFILESYLKTMSYVHCRQSFFGKILKASASEKCYCENY